MTGTGTAAAPGSAGPVTVVLGSAGQRPYLVQVFRAAVGRLGLTGEVVVLESDPASPALVAADRGIVMPPADHETYAPAMEEWFGRERPTLFVPVDDVELQVLSEGLALRLRALGCAVAGPGPAGQAPSADKYLMARLLTRVGVPVPRTVLGSRWESLADDAAPGTAFVVKHRFGSGSSGLRLARRRGLADAVDQAAQTAHDAHGHEVLRARDAVVVQERLAGEEYGVDGVFGFGHPAGVLGGTLARRKLRMRAGQTDRAMTVDPAPFAPVVARLGGALRPSGLVDIDIVRDHDGVPWVLDVNPRFGGGYPFNHVAGADAPTFLLASALGRAPDPSLLGYEIGVVAERFEEVRRLDVRAVGHAREDADSAPAA